MKPIKDSFDNLKVLVIEDNLGDFTLIEDYLLEKFEHINISHFTDFNSSIDYLKDNSTEVSIIFLDLHLSNLNGADLIKKALAFNYKIPIIILTGHADLNLAKESLQMGVYDYLVKDEINPTVLYKSITYALNRSSYVHEIEAEKNNYENLFNFNPQPTWILDSKSLKILNANIAAQKKYGFLLEDFLKMSFTQLHDTEEENLINQEFNSNEKLVKTNFTHYLSNGNAIRVNLYFSKIESGPNDKIIVQSNDVSERLDILHKIEAQNTKLKSIAWTQSNVLRGPILRILGIVNLMEQQPNDIERVSYWIQKLRAASDEVDQITKEIIDQTDSFEQPK